MKVFISADIEGIATTNTLEQCNIENHPHMANPHAHQMAMEVKAACEGAIEAGATDIVVRDAHWKGINIDGSLLPEGVELIHGWTGHPYSMVYGIDSSFDAAMFVGYHCAAGRDGNPRSHTISGVPMWIKLNGDKLSEFQLYSYACALEGVPSVFLSGDKMLCEDSKLIHPMLETVAVKDGFGGMSHALHPMTAASLIREGAKKALSQNLEGALCQLPSSFKLEICYKDHAKATYNSYYPGFSKIDDNTICMETENYMDVLRALNFVLM